MAGAAKRAGSPLGRHPFLENNYRVIAVGIKCYWQKADVSLASSRGRRETCDLSGCSGDRILTATVHRSCLVPASTILRTDRFKVPLPMYEPIETGRRHAIREALFGLVLSQSPSPEQVQRFVQFGKVHLKAELPGFEEITGASPIQFGAVQLPIAFPFGGVVSFQAFQPDGSLRWRLHLTQNQLVVNCIDYELWDSVWPKAREWLRQAAEHLVGGSTTVTGATLQYINGFFWNDPATEPHLRSLFREKSDNIPATFWSHPSREWHLHQGWFTDLTDPVPGRILTRDHLSSALMEEIPTVTVDLMRRYDFIEKFAGSKALFDDVADPVFAKMRTLVRGSLRNYIDDPMLDRIGAGPLP